MSLRALGEDDWATYRQMRLAALKESPDAFVSTYAEEELLDEDFWRLRMRRSTRLLAERDDEPVGVASLGSRSRSRTTRHRPQGPQQRRGAVRDVGRARGRGTGVAWRLVDAAAGRPGTTAAPT